MKKIAVMINSGCLGIIAGQLIIHDMTAMAIAVVGLIVSNALIIASLEG